MLLTRLDLRGLALDELPRSLPPPPGPGAFPTEAVAAIVAEVRADGDEALRRLTQRFDGVALCELRVDQDVVSSAPERIDPALRQAMELAWHRILAYHAHEPAPPAVFELQGVVVEHLLRPVRRAGIYAPGGRARYPSTVLMAAAPAVVAGVDEVALVVPPGPDGEVAVETLAAAATAGIGEVYRVGGAQAVAALAFGTRTIPAVDVIVGPGNRFVAEAKRQVSGIVGIPGGFAGPSEVVVVADASTPPSWAAVDVVVQAEHGPDGLAWLVTWDADYAEAVGAEVAKLVADSPRRRDLEATLGHGGYSVVVDGPRAALAVANAVAPEHLELQVEEPEALLPLVRHAGAVFLGRFAPASVGDYVAGPNHILPTARTARFASALRADDFRTHVHAVSLDPAALARLAPTVATLAGAEGLPAHARSVLVRSEP